MLFLALVAVPAAADTPAKKPAPVQPAKKTQTPTKPAPKKGPVVQEISAPIVVQTCPAKPSVVYVSPGGKNVTGRPKTDDRLKGLGPGTK